MAAEWLLFEPHGQTGSVLDSVPAGAATSAGIAVSGGVPRVVRRSHLEYSIGYGPGPVLRRPQPV